MSSLRPGPQSPLEQALRGLRPGFATLVVFSCGINLLLLASPLYMWQIYDRVLASGRVETLIFLTLITAAALLGLGALDAVRGHILGRMGRWLDRSLTPDLITASLRRTLRGEPAGGQALRDLATMRGVLAGPGATALLDAPWAPAFISDHRADAPAARAGRGRFGAGSARDRGRQRGGRARALARRCQGLDPRDAAGRGGDPQRRRRPGDGHARRPSSGAGRRSTRRRWHCSSRPLIATRFWSACPSFCACSSRS